jgi:UDP-N-acetylglucosamine--N-acetylmuramyl-(pentapeptide) pyrophosphoryl-undecaprenol N-acetylglucosamine transferase
MTRYLFYASNGFGLGHLMRTLGIARALRSRQPDASIMFVTNSEACQLAWRDQFPAIKLLSPTIDNLYPTVEIRDEIRRINRGVVASVMRDFDPDAVIVDFFPLGHTRELQQLRNYRARKIFIARERPPQAPGREVAWAAVREIYDFVLVPHNPDDGVAPVPGGKPHRYTGTIMVRSRDEAFSREEARARLGLPAHAFVVYVGFGGGGRPGYEEVRNWVLAQAPRFPEWLFAVTRPPLYRGAPLAAGPANLREVVYAPLAECWPAFDAAISGLGYNGTAELLHHGVPTVFVEMEDILDNWPERAERIGRAGAGLLVKAHDSAALQRSLDVLADPARRAAIAAAARAMVPVNGAVVAAEAILDFVGQPSRQAST